MLAIAPNTTTLPQRAPRVNTQPQEITAAQARCMARMAIVYDAGLSDKAVRLYLILDDHAGPKGVQWTDTSKLATSLGVAERHVFRLLGELEKAGRISRVRGKYRSAFRMTWASEELTKMSVVGSRELTFGGAENCHFVTKNEVVSINEPRLEPVVCSRCNGTGYRRVVEQFRGRVSESVVLCRCDSEETPECADTMSS